MVTETNIMSKAELVHRSFLPAEDALGRIFVSTSGLLRFRASSLEFGLKTHMVPTYDSLSNRTSLQHEG